MQYRIHHRTSYHYRSAVNHCHNLAYLLPRDTDRQQCVSSEIIINPAPSSSVELLDSYGNRALDFSIYQPHDELEINAYSVITLLDQRLTPDFSSMNGYQRAKQLMYESVDNETVEASAFLATSQHVQIFPELYNYAAAMFSDQKPFLQSVYELTQRIYSEFEYDPGFTEVSTPLTEIFQYRRGVCQDFAHFAIGCLRSLGFAARYVSGYLESVVPEGQQQYIGADASHAWFAVYSPGEGWFDFDPTNNQVTGSSHLVTAWGRDYADVAPLKGVIYGGGNEHTLDVAVQVERIGFESLPN